MKDRCIQYEDMTTLELESILRESVADETIPAEDLVAIAEILNQRDAENGIRPPDAESAWNRFVTKMLNRTSDSPSVARVKTPIHLRKHFYRRCAVIVVCSITVISIICSNQAFAMYIRGIFVRWTPDIFHFEVVGEDTEGFEGTRSEDVDFSDGVLPAEFTPRWMPDGFREVNRKHYAETGLESISVEYMNEDNLFLSIVLSKYNSAAFLSTDSFEKQSPDVEICVCNGKTFVLSKNGELNFWSAAWTKDSLLLHIQGNVPKNDFVQILFFLGGSL